MLSLQAHPLFSFGLQQQQMFIRFIRDPRVELSTVRTINERKQSAFTMCLERWPIWAEAARLILSSGRCPADAMRYPCGSASVFPLWLVASFEPGLLEKMINSGHFDLSDWDVNNFNNRVRRLFSRACRVHGLSSHSGRT